MLCYRDMTFCSFYTSCKDGDNCFRALTDNVLDDARNSHLSVSQFMEKPDCFKESKAKMKRFVDVIKKGYSNE